MQEESGVFWQLVEDHRAGLWRFALGLTHSREDARDLVSETVLAAHRSFSKLRDHAAFQKSLMTIAIRLYRRQRWRGRIFRDIAEAREIPAGGNRESNYDLDLLMQTLGKLPERQREAILLFEISGLSIEEIRAIQGGTLSGVKARLKRGRESLRTLLVDDVSSRKPKTQIMPEALVPTIF
jgi:RNA polymerase sigma-70 factor, ECF subfamily